MNISVKSVRNWVQKNLAPTNTEFVKDPESEKIAKDHQQVDQDLVKIDKDLEASQKAGEQVELSLDKLTNQDLLLSGASAGIVTGAVIGAGADLIGSTLPSSSSIKISSTQHDIMQTEMARGKEPWSHSSTPSHDASGAITGWKHQYTPHTETTKVGSYEVESAEIVNAPKGSLLGSALTGAAVGGIAGVAISAAIIAGRKIANKGIPGEATQSKNPVANKKDLKVIARFGMAGAGVGAAAGVAGAYLESLNTETAQYTVQSPIFEKTSIGKIPQNGFEALYTSTPYEPSGMRNVEVDNPVMKGFGPLERPRLNTQTQTVSIEPRYDYVEGALAGAVIGTGTGIAVGVLTNIIRKSV